MPTIRRRENIWAATNKSAAQRKKVLVDFCLTTTLKQMPSSFTIRDFTREYRRHIRSVQMVSSPASLPQSYTFCAHVLALCEDLTSALLTIDGSRVLVYYKEP